MTGELPPVRFGAWRRTVRIGARRGGAGRGGADRSEVQYSGAHVCSQVLNLRTGLLVIVALVFGLAAFLVSVSFGKYSVPLPEVFAILAGEPHGFASKVVLEWRLPRAVSGLIFGAALGISGAIFQSITRNPLGSPDVIGLSAGAYTGALIAAWYFASAGSSAVALLSLAGGLGAAAIVYLLSYRRGISGIRFVVVGIAVSAALTAVNSIMLLRMSTRFATMVSIWAQGTLVDVRWGEVLPIAAGVLLLLGITPFLAPALRQLELGDSAAASTGVRIERARILLLGIGVLLIALVTSLTGPIAFVSLVAPQLARLLTGSPGVTLVGSAAVGALLLAGADAVAAHALPVSLPVGVLTGVLGGAYLLWLILREARARR